MELDVQPFLTIPEQWFFAFRCEALTEADLQRGIDVAKQHLAQAQLHPFTGFAAYDMLCLQWLDIFESCKSWEELREYQPVCAWADVWASAARCARNSLPGLAQWG